MKHKKVVREWNTWRKKMHGKVQNRYESRYSKSIQDIGMTPRVGKTKREGDEEVQESKSCSLILT